MRVLRSRALGIAGADVARATEAQAGRLRSQLPAPGSRRRLSAVAALIQTTPPRQRSPAATRRRRPVRAPRTLGPSTRRSRCWLTRSHRDPSGCSIDALDRSRGEDTGGPARIQRAGHRDRDAGGATPIQRTATSSATSPSRRTAGRDQPARQRFAFAVGRTGRGLSFFRGAVTLYMTTTILIFIVLLSGYPPRS